MTDETALALGPLEDRARALAPDQPVDRLSLRDYVTSVDIGAFQHERGQPQRLRFSVVLEIPVQGPADDDVDRVLSYDLIAEAIEAELRSERLALLETLADRICARLLSFRGVLRVFLRIEKLDRGPGALGIERVRGRPASPAQEAEAGPQAPAGAPGTAPSPVVLYLDKDPGTGLSALLDRLPDGPFVVVPGAPDLPLPEAGAPAAARRIRLLALEQAAWALAARDARLAVVATRTEFDWALGRGHRVVWAPSKLVLDTPGAPQEAEGATLAVWLAELLGARRLYLHGHVAMPAESRVPVAML